MKRGYAKCMWAARHLKLACKLAGLPPPTTKEIRAFRRAQPNYGKPIWKPAPVEKRLAPEIRKHTCRACGIVLESITKHHLVPVSQGSSSRKTIPLCRPCHVSVHAMFSNHELATEFNTEEVLLVELARRLAECSR